MWEFPALRLFIRQLSQAEGSLTCRLSHRLSRLPNMQQCSSSSSSIVVWRGRAGDKLWPGQHSSHRCKERRRLCFKNMLSRGIHSSRTRSQTGSFIIASLSPQGGGQSERRSPRQTGSRRFVCQIYCKFKLLNTAKWFVIIKIWFKSTRRNIKTSFFVCFTTNAWSWAVNKVWFGSYFKS